MRELLATNDLVFLSWAQAALGAHDIDCLLLDHHVSTIEGSIGVIPRRLMVHADDLTRARWVIETERRALETDDDGWTDDDD